MSSADKQQPLWRPAPEQLQGVEMARFMRWAGERRGRRSRTTRSCGGGRSTSSRTSGRASGSSAACARRKPYERVLGSHAMPGARWFEGAELNYAENLLRRGARRGRATRRGGGAALPPSCVELEQLSWGELAQQVAAAAGGLRALGVERGDRVVAYMPNIPETLIAFLAVASIGAIWSSAAPEFGARSVIDRFAQIEPKVLLAVDGYRHGGKDFDRTANVRAHPRRAAEASSTWSCCPTCAPATGDGAAGGGGGRSRCAHLGSSCWPRRRAPSCASSRCRSITRCGCSTRRARPGCRRRSCRATAASCSSS